MMASMLLHFSEADECWERWLRQCRCSSPINRPVMKVLPYCHTTPVAAAPVVHSVAPVVHSVAPVIHSVAPVIHSVAPVVHSVAPVIHSAASAHNYYEPDQSEVDEENEALAASLEDFISTSPQPIWWEGGCDWRWSEQPCDWRWCEQPRPSSSSPRPSSPRPSSSSPSPKRRRLEDPQPGTSGSSTSRRWRPPIPDDDSDSIFSF